ncbi:DUF537-domain-containing protein [Pseudohyphozyma bogoriensis]|nr:DUF537-domain-containing protein [Pseudohyphozyma bogoriensis]
MASTSNAVAGPSRSGKDANQPVAIFWDYENVRLPTSFPVLTAIPLLRNLSRSHGKLVSFRAYLDTELERGHKSSGVRRDLQASGVSIQDTPHNGGKDVADKQIIVDIFSFALDHPSPATVILITGDKDFSYALSTLRNRLYTVVLICPALASPTLTSQADVVVDWRTGVLKLAPETTVKSLSGSQATPSHRKNGKKKKKRDSWKGELLVLDDESDDD